MLIGLILKQPWEVLDWDIDCSPAFNDDSTDSVAAVEVEITPSSGLSVTPVVMGTNKVKVWIGGGNNNVNYSVEVKVTTTAGRKKEDEIEVRVGEVE
jgi:hypothetical protein